MSSTAVPAEASSSSATLAEPYLTPKGPVVPRSHSFLPLRCGPPVYFPLPAPYDDFCLTGVFATDLPEESLAANGDADGDVEMDKGESYSSSGEGLERLQKLGQVEGTGGWEYPIIRRTAEVKSVNTDPAVRPTVLGMFSLRPKATQASSSSAAAQPSMSEWSLRDVWIDPSERQKGLATLVITYVLYSWLLRLPAPTPSVITQIDPVDTVSAKFLARLGFSPATSSDQASTNGEGNTIEYIWAR